MRDPRLGRRVPAPGDAPGGTAPPSTDSTLTASTPQTAVPATTAGAPASGRVRGLLPPLAVILGVATLLRVGFDQYLNYDARYALLWARDLYNGVTPDYTADFAPTPHPLETWVSVLAVPFGDAADAILIWLILLCFGLLVWLTYRLGATLFHPWVGIVTAIVVATRPALFRDALIGYQDTAFACAIVGAVLLEAKRPRRGEAVLGLLILAGLMRPEGWALGGLYALWMFPACDWPRRIRLLAMACVAPLLWAAMDWYVTGDPLHSLHGTADLAEAVDRRREPEQAPYWTLQYFGYVLREPIVLGLPIGLFFAWRFRLPQRDPAARRRRRDDRRVHDRAVLRAAADRPLRADALRAARALLRPRRRRLAAARPGPPAAVLDVGRHRGRRLLDRVPAVARADGRRHALEPRPAARASTSSCGPWRSRRGWSASWSAAAAP